MAPAAVSLSGETGSAGAAAFNGFGAAAVSRPCPSDEALVTAPHPAAVRLERAIQTTARERLGIARLSLPPPTFPDGMYIETESGVYVADRGRLTPVETPELLIMDKDFDPSSVVYLPAEIIRPLTDAS